MAFEVSLEVVNSGDVAGDEVAQLYLRDDLASVVRPDKELRGFERIHLEVGERRQVAFRIGRDELCFYGDDNIRTVEPGSFTVTIRRNAEEVMLSGSVTVTR